MTIERDGRRIVIECDTMRCSATFEGEEGDAFETVWPAAKRAGWKTRKIGTDWIHGCPRCGV